MLTYTIKPTRPVPLTPALLGAFRERMGWSRVDLAIALGASYDAVRRWETGNRKIPGPVSAAVGLWIAAVNGRPRAAPPATSGRDDDGDER